MVANERIERAAIGPAFERALEAKAELTRAGSYADLAESLADGRLDLAWLPPAAYVHARRTDGVRLVATVERSGTADYRGVLLGHTGAVASVERAAGARAAWVDAWSLAGYFVPRALLKRRGIDPDEMLAAQCFYGSYDAAIDAVSSRAAELAGSFCSVDAEGRIAKRGWSSVAPVRVLAMSAAIPSDTICTGPSLTAAESFAIRSLLARGTARDLATSLGATGFVPGVPSRYDPIARATLG